MIAWKSVENKIFKSFLNRQCFVLNRKPRHLLESENLIQNLNSSRNQLHSLMKNQRDHLHQGYYMLTSRLTFCVTWSNKFKKYENPLK